MKENRRNFDFTYLIIIYNLFIRKKHFNFSSLLFVYHINPILFAHRQPHLCALL